MSSSVQPGVDDDRFLAALLRLSKDSQPVHIEISKAQLWAVLCQLQLPFRHPHNTGATRDAVEKLADALAARLSSDPDLRLFWHMGKAPMFDHVVKQAGQ